MTLSDEEEESWPIRVDAICINRRDIKEGNAKVPRMRDIYTMAAGVTAWLGTGAEDNTSAL